MSVVCAEVCEKFPVADSRFFPYRESAHYGPPQIACDPQVVLDLASTILPCTASSVGESVR